MGSCSPTEKDESFTIGSLMEWIFEVFATFLLTKLGQTIKQWSVRFQNAENDEPEEAIKKLKQSRCPLRPRFPSPDYLEAMIGDLLEWQSQLQQQGLSKCHILLLTVLAIARLAIEILLITLQNMPAVIQTPQQAEVIESPITSKVVSEGNSPDKEPI